MKVCPFIAGMNSQQRGLSLKDNPHDRDNDTDSYCMWIRGFNWNIPK